MNTEAMQTFSALLAVAAMCGSVVLLACLTVARGTGFAGSVLAAVRDNAAALWLLLAGTAMAGSLWFSEVADYAPCKLCWYQRIAMYSIAVVSLVALVRREARVVAPYVLTLALVGLAVSSYHYLLEWYPTLESGVCSVDVPCTTIWFRTFGFVTLPFMAGVAFVSTALVAVAGRKA
ncbi:MAG: disulfide bond formation protein B [Ilumatobacteraceae bacterium]